MTTQRFRCLVLLTFFSTQLAVSVPIVAGTALETGKQAYKNQNYSQAVEALLPLAEQGNADAQEIVSMMYDFGYGVAKDPVKALFWYERAATQDKPLLQHDLGVRYFRGDGIPQSYEKASFWWSRAAAAGVVDSQYNLALMYSQGLGVEKDFNEAIVWYYEAANQGHPDSQYSLGVIYSTGQAGEVNVDLAFQFFMRAAENGIAEAQYNLAQMYESGKGVARNVGQARQWYEKAASNGISQANIALTHIAAEDDDNQVAQVAEDPVLKQVGALDHHHDLILELQHALSEERKKSAKLTRELAARTAEIDQLKGNLERTQAQIRESSSAGASPHIEGEITPGNADPTTTKLNTLASELARQTEINEQLAQEKLQRESRQSFLEMQVRVLSVDLQAANETIEALQNNTTSTASEPGAPITSLPSEATLQAYKTPTVSGKILEESENRIFAGLNQEQWVLQQKSEAYTLQLIELPSMDFVGKFFDIYPLYGAEKAFFKSRKDGKDVYNLVYGVFPDQQSARQEIRRLPEDLRKKQPLVRKYETIQQYVNHRGL